MFLFQGLPAVKAMVLVRLLLAGLVVGRFLNRGKRRRRRLHQGELSVVVWPCDTGRVAVRIEGDV